MPCFFNSFPTMSVNSPNKLQELDDVQNFHMPDGDDTNDLITEHEQDSVFLGLGGLMQLPNIFKSQMLSSVAQLNSQDCITLLVGDPACFSSDPLDVENGSLADTLTPIGASGNPKSEGFSTIRKVFLRQVSGNLGGKFTQHLVEYFLVLLRISPRDLSTAERTHDASVNKCRKYKRSASFDSRKVGLFFSILSIMGTLILIYLTLRVRQIGETALIPA